MPSRPGTYACAAKGPVSTIRGIQSLIQINLFTMRNRLPITRSTLYTGRPHAQFGDRSYRVLGW
jgi:hypothetical protein